VINENPFLDYTIRDGWLYKLNFLCVPHSEDYLFLIREVHTSSYRGHFGTKKTIQHLQHQFHWPSMQPQVEKFIRACALCSQSKPSNRKHGLYQPLSASFSPSIQSFLSGVPTTQKKHDNLVVVCFRKLALFIPCTKTTTAAKTMNSTSDMSGPILASQALSSQTEILSSSTHF
jgi:hypothetical protein